MCLGSLGQACFSDSSILLTVITAVVLLLLKSLQSCPTLCDPIDGSPPGSTVPGIVQARHWSGLPFPSLVYENEKWKWSHSVVSDSLRPHGLQPTRLLCPWDFPSKSTGVGCHCLLQLTVSSLRFIPKWTHLDPTQHSSSTLTFLTQYRFHRLRIVFLWSLHLVISGWRSLRQSRRERSQLVR